MADTAKVTKKAPDIEQVRAMIDGLVKRAQGALGAYMSMTQEQVDKAVHAMALAGIDEHMALARAAVDETGRGVYEDKISKNLFSTEYIYHSIKYEKTVGVIDENKFEDYEEVAEPVGVIAGVTPVTNPTSTTMFKALIAVKTRNPIVFAFHPGAQKCSAMAAQLMHDAAVRAGAPENCIQWIDAPSLAATQALMMHPGVSMILATGGSDMVKSAYSCGKPALGVGPGNVPCYIHESAKLERACTDLMLSKTFDNGMICASEQAVIVGRAIQGAFERFMKDNNCVFLDEAQTERLSAVAIDEKRQSMNAAVVGKSAHEIAKMAGIDVPENAKILLARLEGVGAKWPLSREKLSPILAYYVVEDAREGIERAEQMIDFGGLGHSAVIHATDEAVIAEFRARMKAGRIIINSPSTHGAIGDIYNTNMPSLTLGCGSFGSNSTTANVSAVNLINKKRVANRRVNMQWFKIPEKIYFMPGATRYLEDMPNIHRAFIVADPGIVRLGFVDRVLYHLRNRKQYVHCEIFSEVDVDPSIDTLIKGCEAMKVFNPDVIIALGGGSAIDAAKGMQLYYENPDIDFAKLRLKFMDIRKRAYKFPKLGNKTKLVAIPTTSGTGSEVTSFAVITDKQRGTKYPLADYELTPDIAIIDPEFVMTVPPHVTADTGMDVLTHAVESFVSSMASDYTDALSLHAIKLVFEYLPRAYRDGSDQVAREKMHNASCIAGMAFTNAFLGINHSLAHKLGGEFHVPHGRANAVLMPHVIEYNGRKPDKFVSFPYYETFIADRKYQQIAQTLGLPAATPEEGVASLANAVRGLLAELNMPASIAGCGVEREAFLAKVSKLADSAFEDQCTTANPKLPLVKDLEEIYLKAY